MEFTYILLNLGTLLFPLVLSFDKKVHFIQYWKFLFPAIAITAMVFLLWDYAFVQIGIWSFNPKYTITNWPLKIPLGEILFFITVPYACVFIYECLIAYFKPDPNKKHGKYIDMGLALLALILVITQVERTYTAITAGFMLLLFVLKLFFSKGKWTNAFYWGIGVSLVPFLIVNGILTALPVVIYNDSYNLSSLLGTRIFSIPPDDVLYMVAMLLMTTQLYEWFKRLFAKKEPENLSAQVDQ